MISRLIGIFLSVFSATAFSAVSPNAGKVSLWLRQGSTTTTSGRYDSAVFLPTGYDPATTRRYPLILSLHGLGGSLMNTYHTSIGGLKSGYIKQVWGTSLAQSKARGLR